VSERPTEFVVQRSKWLRGGESAYSCLLTTAGHRCCLGFVASQCGVPDGALLKRSTPSVIDCRPGHVLTTRISPLLLSLREDQEDGHEYLVDSPLSEAAIAINDDGSITEAEREAQLTALFAEHGYALRFEP
jgi:hypothetical protein